MLTAMDITGRRMLLADPRLIEENYNVLPSLGEARKLGRVLELGDDFPGARFLGGASVVQDPRTGRVRIYYEVGFSNEYRLVALAESDDGRHFRKPALGLEEYAGSTENNLVRVALDLGRMNRLVAVPRAEGDITVDGTLSEPAWAKAAVIDELLDTHTGRRSDLATTVRLLRGRDALYLGVDIPGRGIWPKYDPPPGAFEEDNVEIFIDSRLSRRDFSQFVVNGYGTMWTRRVVDGREVPVEPAWSAAAVRRDDGWTVEAAIPYAALDLGGEDPGCGWGFCIAHNVKVESGFRGENWGLVGSYGQPQAYGVLVFDEAGFSAKYPELRRELVSGRLLLRSRRGPGVIFDPAAPRAEQYKMIWREGGTLFGAASPDGCSFETRAILTDRGHLDTMNQILWDPALGRYVAYTRWWYREPAVPLLRRTVARMESQFWDRGWSEREVVSDPLTMAGNLGYQDYYTPGVFLYEGLYFALTSVFLRDVDLGPVEPMLQISADGVTWVPACGGRPVIRRSDEGWDAGMIFYCPAPAVRGDDIYLYYQGCAAQHMEPEDVQMAGSRAIGLARLRRDGFLGYHGVRGTTAFLTTVPVVFTRGQELYVNVEPVASGGELRVGVVASDRCTAEACLPVRTDGTAVAVSWREGRLSEFRGRPIRLTFHLDGVRLYGFEVR